MAKTNKESVFLTGKLLVAMPHMQDPRFDHGVIFVCGHDANGGMGLVINKYADTLTLEDLMDQLKMEINQPVASMRVHFGGPVEIGRGFVLHSSDYTNESSVRIDENFVLTATIDILKDIALGKGPKKCLLALGYAGWSPGQLETELQTNGWLSVDPDDALVFGENVDTCWERAIAKIGIDPAMLSTEAGHA